MAEFNNLTPITRREQFLQDIADGTVDKTPITREEWFLAQIAEAVAHGGGGDSLPAYTAADKGKFLGLDEDAEHTSEEIVVPEQSVTVSGGSGLVAEYDAEFFSGVQEGDTAVLTVNGTDYNVTAVVEEQGVGFLTNGEPPAIYYVPGTGCLFGAENDGDYTVSLKIVTTAVAPAWVSGGSLPSYTSADIGKALVINGSAVPVTLIPEQTVQFTNNVATIPTVDMSYDDLELGLTAQLTFNTNVKSGGSKSGGVDIVTMTVVLDPDDGSKYFSGGEDGAYKIRYVGKETRTAANWEMRVITIDAYFNGNAKIELTSSGQDPTLGWGSVSGTVYGPLSDTVISELQTLMTAIITYALTNSSTALLEKTTILGTSYTGYDDDSQMLADAVSDFSLGKPVSLIALQGNWTSIAIATHSEDFYSIQFVIPHYTVNVPGVGQASFSLSMLIQDGNSMQVTVTAQKCTAVS